MRLIETAMLDVCRGVERAVLRERLPADPYAQPHNVARLVQELSILVSLVEESPRISPTRKRALVAAARRAIAYRGNAGIRGRLMHTTASIVRDALL